PVLVLWRYICVLPLRRCIVRFSSRGTPPALLDPLSLHDALPICRKMSMPARRKAISRASGTGRRSKPMRRSFVRLCAAGSRTKRSEEHTSELQSRENLVCRLLLEKKKEERERRHECTRREYNTAN